MLLLDVSTRPLLVFPQRHPLWSVSSVKMQMNSRTFCDRMWTIPMRIDSEKRKIRLTDSKHAHHAFFWCYFFQMNRHLTWVSYLRPDAIWIPVRDRLINIWSSFSAASLYIVNKNLYTKIMKERKRIVQLFCDWNFGQILTLFFVRLFWKSFLGILFFASNLLGSKQLLYFFLSFFSHQHLRFGNTMGFM